MPSIGRDVGTFVDFSWGVDSGSPSGEQCGGKSVQNFWR